MKRLKVAVVGAGFMGRLHAKTLAECDSADLIAVIDINEELGRSLAKQLNTNYIQYIEEALENDIADAYTVALPDRLHVDVTSKILRAGKSVLLEKPMADTLEGARKIAEAEKEGGGRLMIAHIMRFDGRYAEAARTIRNGDIGDVVHVSAKRFSLRDVGIRMNGKSSVMFYLGIHDVDAIQWVTNKKVKNVFARSVSKVMPEHGVESEDAIFANLEYEDGTIGTLGVSWALPDYMPSGINASIEIIGTKGVVKIDTSDHGLHILKPSGFILPDTMHWPEVHGKIAGDLKDEVLSFVTSVRDGKDFVISVEEAMQAVALNDAILKSVETNQLVEVEKPIVENVK
nr:Gfo/Idh/MocA family oxidoreductase [Fredinandcohnia onubensis]